MIDIAIPLFLVICGIAVVFVRDLFGSIMIFSVYSLVMAIEWVRLNAVDVAITEAAVGAGISTVLFIAVLGKTVSSDTSVRKLNPAAAFITICLGAALLYGTADLPALRDPSIPPSTHVVPEYLDNTYKETGAINVVTAVLASYRGYDTLGETTVVATAGLCVILLLRRMAGDKKDNGPAGGEGLRR